MANLIIYKFRVSGMHDSVAVTSVRNSLSTIPGIGAINVNLRKMQVEIIASRTIEATVLRKALAGTDFTLSELSMDIKQAPHEIRDDDSRNNEG